MTLDSATLPKLTDSRHQQIQVRYADLADHGRLHATPRRHRIVLPPGSDRRLLGQCCSKQISNRPSSIQFHRTGHRKVTLGPRCHVSFSDAVVVCPAIASLEATSRRYVTIQSSSSESRTAEYPENRSQLSQAGTVMSDSANIFQPLSVLVNA